MPHNYSSSINELQEPHMLNFNAADTEWAKRLGPADEHDLISPYRFAQENAMKLNTVKELVAAGEIPSVTIYSKSFIISPAHRCAVPATAPVIDFSAHPGYRAVGEQHEHGEAA